MAIGSNLGINHRRPYETGHLPPDSSPMLEFHHLSIRFVSEVRDEEKRNIFLEDGDQSILPFSPRFLLQLSCKNIYNNEIMSNI